MFPWDLIEISLNESKLLLRIDYYEEKFKSVSEN